LLCRACLSRFTEKITKLGVLTKARFYVCRTCGAAESALLDATDVVVVLDEDADGEPVVAEDCVRCNWLKRGRLFDFDRVEIVKARDHDVERFCIVVGNDMDPFRRPRYKGMRVSVGADCRLSDNAIRILKSMFGSVGVGGWR
jgi:hypothetical protein